MEFRQVFLPGSPCVRDVFVSWYSNFGLAVAKPNRWEIVGGACEYIEPARYFYLGCVHEWGEQSPEQCRAAGIQHLGMFDHHYLCKKCGSRNAHDSS